MEFEYYDNFLKVTNYRQLKQLNNDLIEVDKLFITGKNLVILSMDNEVIVINGTITEIRLC